MAEKEGLKGDGQVVVLPDSPSYDLFLTIIGGEHIPVGDLQGKSDGYIIAKVKNGKGLLDKRNGSSDARSDDNNHQQQKKHSPASRIHFRTSTKRGTRDPVWNESWRIGGVRLGTYIKLKLYDEDPRKRLDDKLGSIKYVIPGDLKRFTAEDGLTLSLPTRNYKGAKHIQVLTHTYDLVNQSKNSKSTVKVRIELLPPTFPDKRDIHLVNPTRFSVHVSPLVNLVASAPQHQEGTAAPFKAYKISLIHPPPSRALNFSADASHAKSFDPSKLRYRLTHHFIRKQYQSIYGYNSRTVFGGWWGDDLGLGLVELLQPNADSKVFTFVVVTEGEWRFCETGDKYKVNKLSKHSMHADGEETVAWGGEFFVKKTVDMLEEFKTNERAVEIMRSEEGRKHEWTICLDNDSGTYSPDEGAIELFRSFMASNLRGINIIVVNYKTRELQEAKEEQKADNTKPAEDGAEEEVSHPKGTVGGHVEGAEDSADAEVMPPDTETEAKAISNRLEEVGLSPNLSPTENVYISDHAVTAEDKLGPPDHATGGSGHSSK